MSYWNSHIKENEEYVVLRHSINRFDGHVNGIRFREGYCVVVKGSRPYNTLKKLPLIKSSEEYPLIHLRSLKCIMRDKDLETIFGKDVYLQYMKVKTPIIKAEELIYKEEVYKEHIENGRCSFIKLNGEPCGLEAYTHSISKMCKLHILEDKEIISKLGYKIPDRELTRDEQKKYRARIFKRYDK